jgi:sugar (pentulose or hexulose) kinase
MMQTSLLAIDAGTTHIKAGLFSRSGELLAFAKKPTVLHKSSHGYVYYEPDEIWLTVLEVCEEVLSKANPVSIIGIGVSSMAETGLLIEKQSGKYGSWMVPWFDKSSSGAAQLLSQESADPEIFMKTGIYPSFKCSLAKILWLRDDMCVPVKKMVWLSTADFLIFKMTGSMATDYSLAGRTYAFNFSSKRWDRDRLQGYALDESFFPKVSASVERVGEICGEFCFRTGLKAGISVVAAGHDHVCGSFSAGAIEPDLIFDSMGTAEALIGGFPERTLNVADRHSGLSFGFHPARGFRYWMGGLSASGGSLDWARKMLGDPSLNIAELEDLASRVGPEPTGIIFFPYLSGSGAPHTDPTVRAAVVGLDSKHGREHLARAVFEGTAYEMNFILQAALGNLDTSVRTVLAAGGGSKSKVWMQIKADVSGCHFDSLQMSETTMLGAALLAGVGSGLYRDETDALKAVENMERKTYLPVDKRHASYQEIYTQGFLKLQSAIREFGKG